MDQVKYAFRVDERELEPTPQQQLAVDWVCMQVAKRRLVTPGLVFLEMTRPLNWVSSQAMQFLRPAVWALTGSSQTGVAGYEAYVAFSEFLEHRSSMEYMQRRVEYFEQQFAELREAKQPIGPFVESHLADLRAQRADETGNTAAP